MKHVLHSAARNNTTTVEVSHDEDGVVKDAVGVHMNKRRGSQEVGGYHHASVVRAWAQSIVDDIDSKAAVERVFGPNQGDDR